MSKIRKESAIESLFAMPWWISGLLATAAFFSPDILKLVIPIREGASGAMINSTFVTAAETLAPIFATGLLIIALAILAKNIYSRAEPVAQIATPAAPNNPGISDMLAEKFYSEEPPEITPTSWSLQLLQELEWKRFEELCEALLYELGLIARNTKFGADGGIDIDLYAIDEPSNRIAIAQCKAWPRPVGVKEIRAFYAVMVTSSVLEGYFMTTSTFSEEAVKFSQISSVTLINGERVLALIAALPPERSRALLTLATRGDFTTPTCPSCGLKLIPRKSSSSGTSFWGCRRYPRCTGKLNMKKDSNK
ncbi:endonuclease [Mariprofundus sp. NF]|uniref:restriction endonuclease n=1 Tax=Mariprofundus sp. NF TaxID=2608716 RepID=UPI0015A4B7F4|nr:restriction endonuclease [Mariprofundus sp. NF]NWF38465.1 endonuclease [Mariprofundus sp. NF]